MAIWWLDPYIEAAVGGVHGTTDTTTRNGSYAAPFAFSDVVSTSSSATTSINGQSIADGDELRLKGLAYQSFLYNTSTTDNKLDVTYHTPYRFNVVSSEHQTQWDNWLTAHDNMNYNHGVVMYYDPNLIGTHKWLFQNIDVDASNLLLGESHSNASNSLAWGWHEGLQKSTGAWQISMFNPDYIIDRSSTSGTEYYFPQTQYNVTITDGWTSETVRDGVTFIVDENASSGNKHWFSGAISTSSFRDPYYKLDLPDTFIYMYNSNTESNTHRPQLNFNHIPAGETWRLGKFACPSSAAWKYVKVRGDYNNSQLTDTDRDTRKLEIGTLQICSYVQMQTYVGTTTINNYMMYSAPYINTQASYHNRLEFGNMIIYTQYSQNCMLYPANRGASGGFIKILDNALLSAISNVSYLVRPGYDDQMIASDNPETILTSASASWPYPLGDAGNSNYTQPSASGLLVSGTQIYGSINNNSSPTSVTASPASFMATKALAASDITNTIYPNTTVSGVFPNLEFTGDYRNINVGLYVNNIVNQTQYDFHQNSITFSRNSYDGNPMTLAMTSGAGMKPALICYNDNQNNNKLCIQGSSYALESSFYYKNFLQELPAGVSPGDVTGVTITIKATDDVNTNDLYHRGIYVSTAGNGLYYQSSWMQTSNADGYKTFTGTYSSAFAINSYGLSADYPFIWMLFGVRNNASEGKDRKYWIEDITVETA